eukprot:1140914-Pelagomonas_calceolata.AAC.9
MTAAVATKACAGLYPNTAVTAAGPMPVKLMTAATAKACTQHKAVSTAVGPMPLATAHRLLTCSIGRSGHLLTSEACAELDTVIAAAGSMLLTSSPTGSLSTRLKPSVRDAQGSFCCCSPCTLLLLHQLKRTRLAKLWLRLLCRECDAYMVAAGHDEDDVKVGMGGGV